MTNEEQQLTIAEQFENTTIRETGYAEEEYYSLPDLMSLFSKAKCAGIYEHNPIRQHRRARYYPADNLMSLLARAERARESGHEPKKEIVDEEGI